MSGKSQWETGPVRVDWRDNVAIVSLTERVLTNAVRERLAATLLELNGDAGPCWAIVLTSAGDTFCSGTDEQEATGPLSLDLFRLLATGRRPVVAAIEGLAAGPGLSLVAACDYIVATPAARLSCSFGATGLLPEGGLYWSLARRIGAGRARKALMTGRVFSGDEALDAGLASELVSPGKALDKAVEIAARYAAMPAVAMGWLKAVMATGSDTLDQAIETETDIQPLLRFSEDHKEAVQAFLQKRTPNFVGR